MNDDQTPPRGTPVPRQPPPPGAPEPSTQPPPPTQAPSDAAQPPPLSPSPSSPFVAQPSPPPPPFPSAPPAPPGWGAQPGGATPQYTSGSPYAPTSKAPRPRSPVGAFLMIAGAVIAIIGSFLPWANAFGQDGTGFDTYTWFSPGRSFDLDNPGALVIIGAVMMLGLGIATMIFGRVIAVTIIGIISAVLGILGGGLLLWLMSDFADTVDGNVGIGVVIQPIAPVICLVGATLATRSKRPSDQVPQRPY